MAGGRQAYFNLTKSPEEKSRNYNIKTQVEKVYIIPYYTSDEKLYMIKIEVLSEYCL